MRKSMALLILACLLPACGLKGPLYLPQQQQPAAAAPAAAPAVQAGDKQIPDSSKK